jgi:hypothetical protein
MYYVIYSWEEAGDECHEASVFASEEAVISFLNDCAERECFHFMVIKGTEIHFEPAEKAISYRRRRD